MAKAHGTAGRKRKIRGMYDYELLVAVLFLCMFGLIMIYSASSYKAQMESHASWYYVKKQASSELIGLVVMLGISRIDYHRFRRFASLGYYLCYFLMGLMMFTPLGVASHGKKRWLKLGMQFQPSEFIKIALILLVATYVAQLGLRINERRNLIRIVGLCLPLVALVAYSNLSSGIIIAGIVFVMLYVACKNHTAFNLLIVFAVGGIILIRLGLLSHIPFLHAYQLGRINVWLDPVKYAQSGGYQVLQGLYAIGSGGITGKGFGQSLQKLGFVPEAQNDMIFAIICEELGVVGACCMVALFMFLISRFLFIARRAPDLFGSMLVIGIMAQISIQVILNIAVVANVIPNTGVTLPFISYGGTAVLLLMAEMGMALSVSNQIGVREAMEELNSMENTTAYGYR